MTAAARRRQRQQAERGRRVEKRRGEADVARRLTGWAGGLYTFHPRDVGNDLAVDGGPPAWPFAVSVMSVAGPSLATMLTRAYAGEPLEYWRVLESVPGVGLDDARARSWLVWRSEPSKLWLLSCWSLGALHVPMRMALLPNPLGWPRFTMPLDAFLFTVKIEQAIVAIADGWGKP